MNPELTEQACILCRHDPACGYASITHDNREDRLCHEDDHSCYHLWTVYGMRDLYKDHLPFGALKYLPRYWEAS